MTEDDEDFDEYESCTKKRLPAIFAWFLLLTSSSVYFILILPNLPFVIGPNQLYFIILSTIHGLIFFYVLINFLTATLLDPGRYPKVNEHEKHVKIENPNNLTHKTVSVNDFSVRMKWCPTCKFFRPPRCSHCALCDYCIDTMDHHCPWLANCVGRRNYRYFFQFLLSLSLHMIIIFTFCLLYILWNRNNLADTPVIAALILIVLVCLLFLPIGGLTGFHLVLVSRGRTTNEQVTGKFRSGVNPFDMDLCANWRSVICAPLTPNLIQYSRKCVEMREQTIRQLKMIKRPIRHGVMEPRLVNGHPKERIYTTKKINQNEEVWIDRRQHMVTNEHEIKALLDTAHHPPVIRNDSYVNANRAATAKQHQKLPVVITKKKSGSKQKQEGYASYEITV